MSFTRHDRDDGALGAQIPRRQADLGEPESRAVYRPRNESLHYVLSVRALLPRLRGRQ